VGKKRGEKDLGLLLFAGEKKFVLSCTEKKEGEDFSCSEGTRGKKEISDGLAFKRGWFSRRARPILFSREKACLCKAREEEKPTPDGPSPPVTKSQGRPL